MKMITLSPAMIARLEAVSFPAEICGASIEEKALFLLDDGLLGAEAAKERQGSIEMHRRFGIKHPDDLDDEIDL